MSNLLPPMILRALRARGEDEDDTSVFQLAEHFSYTYTREFHVAPTATVEVLNEFGFLVGFLGLDIPVMNLVVPPQKFTRQELFHLVSSLAMLRTTGVTTPETEYLFRVNGRFVDFRPTRTIIVPNEDLQLQVL